MVGINADALIPPGVVVAVRLSVVVESIGCWDGVNGEAAIGRAGSQSMGLPSTEDGGSKSE